MSVMVDSLEPGSPAEKAGFQPGDLLLTLNGHEIADVLDYRFYQNEKKVKVAVLRNGRKKRATLRKGEYDELGFLFSTYLMDEQKHCKNKCVFCFIDQLPPGLRDTLYFKDDDSRLSFLFGNYITLTNITEHEVARIISMHISPINISVHTTNPELRCKMMNNRFAGNVLELLHRFDRAGIIINCQLVLVPGMNDGSELERTLQDLTALPSLGALAAVPVGLTRYRDGLAKLQKFSKESALAVLETLERYGRRLLQDTGSRKVYASDEFYLLAGRSMPSAEFYEDFALLENGVGLWALMQQEAGDALEWLEGPSAPRRVSFATGVSAAPLLREIAGKAMAKWPDLQIQVFPVINDFFGHDITVAGLVTGQDIIAQLRGKDLGETLYFPDVMLRHEGDLFLDDTTVPQLQEALGAPVVPIPTNGEGFIRAVCGRLEE